MKKNWSILWRSLKTPSDRLDWVTNRLASGSTMKMLEINWVYIIFHILMILTKMTIEWKFNKLII